MQKLFHGQKWVQTKGNGWFTKKEVYKWVGSDIFGALQDIAGFGEKTSPTLFWSPEPDYDRLRELLTDEAELVFCGDVICVHLVEQANKNFILKVWVSSVDGYQVQESEDDR